MSLFNAMENNHPEEVANLELNGLPMTANANFNQVRRAVVTALIMRIEQVITKEGLKAPVVVDRILKQWVSTFKRSVFKPKDESEFLLFAQRECAARSEALGQVILLNFVKVLNHDMELVEEESINDWWADERSLESEKMVAVRKLTADYVKWLAEAESESESGSEEESEEESDDE